MTGELVRNVLFIIMVICSLRLIYITGRLKDKIHILKIAVARAEHGFTRIRGHASSGQVVDKEVEKQARDYALEMKDAMERS